MTEEIQARSDGSPKGMPNDMICRIMIVLLLGNDALQMGLI